ncbi:alpha/beta hydrolase [Jiella marina]|uniref:alpha/beta hydrolase n=1 Tax=Jiella sp. LLJ827 TaxID=2917712 RepID=UPI0021010AC6|nr:alpha/beta hydrolase [Jiella sp. LLJ827]MCQ0986773.1 alpha/beta hydrolase [Jiella sp. LLJ827]
MPEPDAAFEPVWTGGAPIADIDAAYDNGAAIPDAASYTPRWAALARAFRDRMMAAGRAELHLPYGEGSRQYYDLFHPGGTPKGLVVFVHGGYWKAQEIGNWSHLAAGSLAHDFAVALPEYTLCPDTSVPDITREIGVFLDHVAARVTGPIHLAGHSAGGHLVTRMLCEDAPIAATTAERTARTVTISGVHDLRPLVRTKMNETLRLTPDEATAESPALLMPRPGVDLVCLAGGAELAEFRRQNALLANVWHGLRAKTTALEQPDRHHFDICDELADPDSRLVAILTGLG